ncbi:MAG: hypothetical protein ABFR62_12385 [Bacteroidota bacterium]
MKNLCQTFFVLALIFPVIANAQKIEKLDAKGRYPVFAENEQIIVVSKSNYNSIEKFELATKKQSIIVEGRGVAYKSYISGEDVYFKKENEMTSINLKTGRKQKQSQAGSPKAAAKMKSLSKKSERYAIDVVPTVMIDGFIVLFNDGTKKEFYPHGKSIYVNAELSPNGSKVLYSGPKGTEILSLTDGTILPLGVLEAAKWAGDNKIVYMITEDDGHTLLKSDVGIYDLSKRTKKNLTENFDGLAQHPSANSDASKVLFSTNKNEIYLITINK